MAEIQTHCVSAQSKRYQCHTRSALPHVTQPPRITLSPFSFSSAFTQTHCLLPHSTSLTLSLSHAARRMPQGWDRCVVLVFGFDLWFDWRGFDLWFVAVGLFCGVLWVCFMVAVGLLVVLCWRWIVFFFFFFWFSYYKFI